MEQLDELRAAFVRRIPAFIARQAPYRLYPGSVARYIASFGIVLFEASRRCLLPCAHNMVNKKKNR